MADLIDKILFRIDVILRYVAPGFVALFVLLASAPGILRFQIQSTGVYASWVVMLAAALTGTLVYSIHTGAIVHVIAWVIIQIHKRILKHTEVASVCGSKRSVVNVMFDLDTHRWLRRSSVPGEVRTIQDELDKWAALLNFLYCSSYAMIIIPLYLRLSRPTQVSCRWWHLACIGGLMFMFALVSSWRIITRQVWAMKTYPNGRKQGTKSS